MSEFHLNKANIQRGDIMQKEESITYCFVPVPFDEMFRGVVGILIPVTLLNIKMCQASNLIILFIGTCNCV